MVFDPKRYKVDVVVPLAKDRTRMDAVAAAIRDLKSGAGESALAPVDSSMLFGIDPRNPGDLAAHFATLELSLNKWGGNPPSASIIKQLLHSIKDAGLAYDQPAFWVAQTKNQEKAQAAQLDGFMAGVKADYPLGVLTPEQLERAAKGAGLGSVSAGTLVSTAQRAGLAVSEDFDAPVVAVPPILTTVLHHPDFRTIADLLVFPGQATSVSFIDQLAVAGRTITMADIAAAHHNSETAKDSNAVQDAQKALGLLKNQCSSDAQLHSLVRASLLKQIASIVGQGGTRLQQRDGLVALGISAVDASRAVSKLSPSGGGSVAKPASLQISEALASGNPAEARRLASALPDVEEDRADRAAAVVKVDDAERQKKTHVDAYDRATAVRDFGSAAHALRNALAIDSMDAVLQSKLDALPPAKPDVPTLVAEGRRVVIAWPAVAENGVKYVVVRNEGGASPVAPNGGAPVGPPLEGTSVADEHASIGKRVRYTVFATRDGKSFSDGAGAELLVVPAPTDLVAAVDVSQVSLSWQMPSEAIAAQVIQHAADGTVETIDVTTGSTLSVRGLTLGMRYAFGVRAAYATADGRELSAPTQIDATPRGAIGAAQNFEVVAIQSDAGSESLQMSWRDVEGYPVDVWAFPVGYQSQPGERATSATLVSSGGRRLTPLPGGSITAGVVTRRFAAGSGVFTYAPVTTDGDGGVLGTTVVSGVAPAATGLAAERFGDGVKISWVWPEGDFIMEVSWSQDGRSRSSRVTRAKYRVDGGVTLSPSLGISDIAVATVVKVADDEWVSAPWPVAFAASRPTIGYTLTLKKGFFKAGSVDVRIDPGDYSGTLDVELVCATGPFMPIKPSDGSVIHSERLTLTAQETLTLTSAIPKIPSPHWVRLFTSDASSVVLLDPPTAQMKG
jgi:hypothetical protein